MNKEIEENTIGRYMIPKIIDYLLGTGQQLNITSNVKTASSQNNGEEYKGCTTISMNLNFEGMRHDVQLKIVQCQTPIRLGRITIREIEDRVSTLKNLKFVLIPQGQHQVVIPWANTTASPSPTNRDTSEYRTQTNKTRG